MSYRVEMTMDPMLRHPILKLTIPVVLLGILCWLSYAVLREFFLVVTWAVIIAYMMWPSFQWLKKKLKYRVTLSAALMTGFISALIALIFYWLGNSLRAEVLNLYQNLVNNLSQTPLDLPESLQQIPWIERYLQPYIVRFNAEGAGIEAQLLDWTQQSLGQLAKFLGSVGRNMLSLGFILVTLFFCFRDGQQAVEQLKQGVGPFLGDDQNAYIKAAGDTTQAVVYGLVLAAVGQGIIAGIGYSVAGAEAPALLGAITALFAMVPMGAPLVWLPVCLGLFVAGDYWQSVGLMLWGFFVVSTVDNVIRPLVISGAGQIPFLVVLFGVFGGLRAFGFVGLFLGPVLLSVLLSVWRAWLKQQVPSE